MSGIEIVGLILGAVPLVISAMEHFEDAKRAVGTFHKIRRAHKRDLGKLKDCQLKFKLNMKELLLPLLADDLVTRIEYEQLLVSPGGSGWREEHVDEALAQRLGECHERYIEILQEMEETLVLLCKATKVDDAQFQALLPKQDVSPPLHCAGPDSDSTIYCTDYAKANASPATRQAKTMLMARAHARFQAKKLVYTLAIPQRETLIEEIERYNRTLEETLVANDRIAQLSQQTSPRAPKSRIPKPLLQFWKHADKIFSLLANAWRCQCKGLHCAKLWLKQRTTAAVDMRLVLKFCHGTQRCVNIELADNDTTVWSGQTPGVPVRLPLRPISQGPNTPAVVVQRTQTAQIVSGHACGATITRTATRVSYAGVSALQQHAGMPALKDLVADGLCETVHCGSQGDCYGLLVDHDSDRQYSVSNTSDLNTVSAADATTLSSVLSRQISGSTLNRMQRYSIAATLVSSVVQLESTPWAPRWEADKVHFPKSDPAIPSQVLMADRPYILTDFGTSKPPRDDRFKALGIVLLELCFGKPLDDHPLWQNPGFAAAKTNPMMRHFVATEWMKDVVGEAGEQYANALKWCFQQAPASTADEKWRADFAQSVAWPLQECFESMQPRK